MVCGCQQRHLGSFAPGNSYGIFVKMKIKGHAGSNHHRGEFRYQKNNTLLSQYCFYKTSIVAKIFHIHKRLGQRKGNGQGWASPGNPKPNQGEGEKNQENNITRDTAHTRNGEVKKPPPGIGPPRWTTAPVHRERGKN